MRERSSVISFYASGDLEQGLAAEAKKRGVSKHALAKMLAISGLETLTISQEVKITAGIQINANTLYMLRNGLIFLVEQARQDLSKEEVIKLVNEEIIAKGKEEAERLLETLGIGE
ncbi:hypothetical protein [Pectobacterium versatile]|uniref:hypothetical protein n=1 Tax=Pectobacterium versatile TaxID=2488639 RepID=UPI001F3213E3|nr:hypothetical protein [Pectobacterium versatile]